MGCCCPKEKNENEADERTRLLDGSQDHNQNHQKSRFLDQPGLASSSHHHLGGGGGQNGPSSSGGGAMNGNALLNDSTLNESQLGGVNGQANGQGAGGPGGAAAANAMQSNYMFEKILSEVIHVSAYDQRGAVINGMNGGFNSGDHLNNPPVQDMSYKFKEPQFDQHQQLSLPEGVPAPLTVLAAQPPFVSDIRLINILATEASNCINNYSLNVPENVAFDFRPVA